MLACSQLLFLKVKGKTVSVFETILVQGLPHKYMLSSNSLVNNGIVALSTHMVTVRQR